MNRSVSDKRYSVSQTNSTLQATTVAEPLSVPIDNVGRRRKSCSEHCLFCGHSNFDKRHITYWSTLLDLIETLPNKINPQVTLFFAWGQTLTEQIKKKKTHTKVKWPKIITKYENIDFWRQLITLQKNFFSFFLCNIFSTQKKPIKSRTTII